MDHITTFVNSLAVKINSPLGNQSITDVFVRVVQNWAIPVAGIVAVGFLVFGGIQYITAAGAEDKIKTAQKTITGAIIGLIIVLAAVAIRATVYYAIGK